MATYKLPEDVLETLAELDAKGKASLVKYPVNNPGAGSGNWKGLKSSLVSYAVRAQQDEIRKRIAKDGIAFLLGS